MRKIILIALLFVSAFSFAQTGRTCLHCPPSPVSQNGKVLGSNGTAFTWTTGGSSFTKDSVDKYAWSLTGNSGTNPATNFVGTTDNQDLVFRRNDSLYGKFTADNLFLGLNAGRNYSKGGHYNIFIGYQSGMNDAPSYDYNTAIGFQALYQNSGNSNTAIGAFALDSNTSGINNVAIGVESSSKNTSGADNVSVGVISQRNTTTGVDNTSIGYGSLYGNTTGSGNVAIGKNAAKFGTLNNRLFISNNNATDSIAQERIALITGIFGTDSSNQKLRINGSLQISDGTQGAGKVLTSDANGLASWQYEDSLVIDSVATTGDTTQLVGNAFVAIIATGAITDLALKFPASPYDNMAVIAKFDYAVALLTADGNGATVYGFPSSTVLGQHREWKYRAASNSWY